MERFEEIPYDITHLFNVREMIQNCIHRLTRHTNQVFVYVSFNERTLRRVTLGYSQAHYLELTGWLYQRDTTIDLVHFLLGRGNVHFQVRIEDSLDLGGDFIHPHLDSVFPFNVKLFFFLQIHNTIDDYNQLFRDYFHLVEFVREWYNYGRELLQPNAYCDCRTCISNYN